ncbi:putative leucine-rich repeat receptor-like serine/threonine-protein kinase At2g24130 [Amaranthus tricolor]|uniref:putative leucine-rich repeat receptor-like serine/threonine-protein kinase At2g24130 n=1 Tax=Amaranthus tricolor TaxID=29722 RepID=UPI00258ACB5E|nr:putative leucine-rich repeat receptor-like serine/threonine-protein kinase At2g24130 [Amaranthus tricolor]
MFLFLVYFSAFTQCIVTTTCLDHQSPYHKHTLDTDKSALLAFKRAILVDPQQSLANWNESTHVCRFNGITCRNRRVFKLALESLGLMGRLSPMLSNLTGLRMLNLADNDLYGSIASDFSSLRHLHDLALDENNLQGMIPDSLSLISNLTLVSLSGNKITGRLPASLFENCTSLKSLDVSQNELYGIIPTEIGNCAQLWNLNLYNNEFTGKLPMSMRNNSVLLNVDIEYNQFSGELPREIVGKLGLVWNLHLSYNKFVSHDKNTNLYPFFGSLTNCTSLKELELAGMGLGGELPSTIGQLNQNLTSLLLQENLIFGSLPLHLANITGLLQLNLTGNILNGTISREMSTLPHLQQLFLSHNFFTGEIPETLGYFKRIGLLDLSFNFFFGRIPESFGNLVQINSLFLNNNLLSGVIPPALGHCTDLYRLDLSYNRFTGIIPPQISGIRQIRIFLNLSHNFLEGPLPIELSKMESVQEIDLSCNNFTGTVFSKISNCIALRVINFSHNSLHGNLPDSMGALKNLESLDVSFNLLSGTIPLSLSSIENLSFLNLSYNDFRGEIPTGGIFNVAKSDSFLGNLHLCGYESEKPTCTQEKRSHLRVILIVISIVISVTGSFIVCFLGITFCSTRTSFIQRTERTRKFSHDLVYNIPRITYRELADATNGFHDEKLIGSGSFGRVYKGVLPDGMNVAVKVIESQSGNSSKNFYRECQVLKRIRHRNLMRIITACSLSDFKALVLPLMANGSLETQLYENQGNLSLIQRVNICSDVAEGMAYLHHYSPVRVIHCDLKPSNILLNDEMTALVSDFGISRLVVNTNVANVVDTRNSGNSTGNVLCGSIGYIAPEYGCGANISMKGDVYSFGIVVLEIISRMKPTDETFVGGLSLHNWIKSHYNGRLERVIDPVLLRALKGQTSDIKRIWEVAICELIELGIICTQDSPTSRPTMVDAAEDLDRLKRYMNGDNTTTFASSLGISSSFFDEN